ncbi:MAG TPA: glycoside hydrolase family 3 C-terminal domain-containing protein [Acidimicrobiales bacterium]|nr:glycoside hydrolase family 3 C-terminal domain-containing protein [Acidimicrobiales bacterium]
MTFDVEAALAAMTLDEKAAVTAGADLWHTVAVERVGLPALRVTDGPNGARGSTAVSSRSTCFPCGSALGATWDPDLVAEMGAALAAETRDKGADALLAPTVNLHRHPLGGRHFECPSEDPFLAGSIAVGYVSGLQGGGVAAVVKHFVANDTEFERMTISAEVPERALRELYLVPFEMAVKEAGAWGVMTSYNRVDGTYASEHDDLVNGLLKGEWGFDGLVMSDWYGTHSTVPAALGGLDLEMPGPAAHLGAQLAAAVRDGMVPEAVLDDKVRRLFRLADRVGALDGPRSSPRHEVGPDRPDRRQLARRVATEAAVLLRNEGDLLPIEASRTRRVAVIGPRAADTIVQGGGSAQVNPHHVVSPLEALTQALGGEVEVVFEPGCAPHSGPTTLSLDAVRNLDGEQGLTLVYRDERGEELGREAAARTALAWWGTPFAALGGPEAASVTASGWFTPTVAGRHQFTLTSAGPGTLHVDGQLVVETEGQPTGVLGGGPRPPSGGVDLVAGQSVLLEAAVRPAAEGGALAIGHRPPEPDDSLDRATAAAAAADVAVVIVGTGPARETEGRDRPDLALPGLQGELVRAVCAANPRTVVAVAAGAPVDLACADGAAAVLQTWFAGQEAGPALADVLTGRAEPGGRLPTTIPYDLADTPSHPWYPGTDGRQPYGEGVFLGYRGFDEAGAEPRFCFGHGLTYGQFDISDLQVDASRWRSHGEVEVSATVANVGDRAGSEVVQFYVEHPDASVPRPPRELKAFAKVRLDPGHLATVSRTLPARAFQHWSEDARAWTFEPGRFVIRGGRSSRDLPESVEIDLGAR